LGPDELVGFLAETKAQAAIVGLDAINEEMFAKLPDLEVVSCCSAGLDHIDARLFKKLGKRVGWVPGVNKYSVSELAISLMINLLRKVSTLSLQMRDGVWSRDFAEKMGGQLRGRTVGIHGCGNVGKEVVKLLKAFGAEVLTNDILDFDDFYAEWGAEKVSPEDLWARSDVLTLHLARNQSTIGLYGAEVLDKLKPGMILINTSRGRIVDEAALRDRLSDGRITGAAFDVFADEPTKYLEIMDLPNFIGTPHIGGSAREAWEAMARAGISGVGENSIPEPGVPPFED
jgi:D-3-phosphoglycerate dehydrogenase